ncbi:TA system VapC family ribonuclease toxin [Mycolicibacterium sp. 050232]|uniref:TA system VapC family ribonuclease toxin n=1 Tax=Mycolicibacterium sp. 050232 TaxID=3113982 RepID=UPI002E2915B9|nr:TA system VapC family ribonuclease toxin [Mycolicibacterium sp. 050232]MED5811452.1 TA system VapC family ribonuclease toxin [Mycolicibacterium sp. 050232]
MPEESGPAFGLPDVNVLVALTNTTHQHHRQAHAWLATCPRFATTPVTENGLIRLLLNPAVVGQQISTAQALTVLTRLRAHDRATFVADSSSLASAAIDTIGLAGHKQATDFHLINLVATAGGTLVTFDRRIAGALAPQDQRFVHVL